MHRLVEQYAYQNRGKPQVQLGRYEEYRPRQSPANHPSNKTGKAYSYGGVILLNRTKSDSTGILLCIPLSGRRTLSQLNSVPKSSSLICLQPLESIWHSGSRKTTANWHAYCSIMTKHKPCPRNCKPKRSAGMLLASRSPVCRPRMMPSSSHGCSVDVAGGQDRGLFCAPLRPLLAEGLRPETTGVSSRRPRSISSALREGM